MRRLLWFSVGFAMVCGFWAYRIEYGFLLPVLLSATIAGAVLLRRVSLRRVLSWILLGCIAASAWTGIYQRQFLASALELDGTQMQLNITASDYSYDTSYRLAVDGWTVLDGKKVQVRAYLEKSDQLTEICPGDRLSGEFRLRTTVPGSAEESVYHQGKGIFLMVYGQETVTVSKAESVHFREYPAVLARMLEEGLKKFLPNDVYAFAKALLLGDTYDLDYATDTALKISGIRHIVAVSGLHISVLYGAISCLTGRKRFLTALIALPVLGLFAAMVGFTPSVTRACIMVGLMILSTVFLREYDAPTALSFAGLVILAWNPLAVTSVSFQLSMLCVVGILLFQQRIKNWLMERFPGKESWRGRLFSGISVSISAMSLVTPLSAWYFGTVSLIGVVTNLLTLWVVNGIFIGLLLLCLVGFAAPGVAKVLGWLLAWPIRFVLGTAKVCAAVPFGAVYTASLYVVFWLIFCYGLLIAFLLIPKQKPGRLVCYAGFGLCLALLLSFAEPMTDDVRITMLDVGQGQSIVIQTPKNTFLVDCGGDSDSETADTVAEYLLSQGISRVDGIVITHYDRDHAGALENLLTRIDADLLILPDTPNSLTPGDFEGELLYLWDRTQIALDGGMLTVFGPVFHGESNENSLCVLFESEKCDILITGDRTDFGERMLMRKNQLPDVDILVAGHHGAESASSRELLAAVKPELVLISVGEENIYGHPNPKLLQRLDDAGIAVRRTDLEGTIIIRR